MINEWMEDMAASIEGDVRKYMIHAIIIIILAIAVVGYFILKFYFKW